MMGILSYGQSCLTLSLCHGLMERGYIIRVRRYRRSCSLLDMGSGRRWLAKV